jgi:hypothetical protein
VASGKLDQRKEEEPAARQTEFTWSMGRISSGVRYSRHHRK